MLTTEQSPKNSLECSKLGYSIGDRRVEVIGIGGAGKSTLLSRLAAFGDSPAVLSGRQPTKRSVFALTTELLAKVISSAPAETITSLATYGGWFLFGKLGYRLAAQQAIKEFQGIVADSGLLQPLITHAIRFGDHSQLPLRPILNYLPLPRMLLVVDCEVETAFARFLKREIGLNRLQVWGRREDLRRRFDYAADRSAIIQEWCLQNGVPVEHIDCTSEPSEQQLHALSAKLLRA